MTFYKEDGFYIIYGHVRGVWVEERYLYYTKREVISKFNKKYGRGAVTKKDFKKYG